MQLFMLIEAAIFILRMGRCIIEKHFTDNKKLPSPDSGFTMDYIDFKIMIIKTKIMEKKNQYFSWKMKEIKSSKKLINNKIWLRKLVKFFKLCLNDKIFTDKFNTIIDKNIDIDLNSIFVIKKMII